MSSEKDSAESSEDQSVVGHRIQDVILTTIADGKPLFGTIHRLARAWGVTDAALRLGIRELLEADRITVQFDGCGRLTIQGASHTDFPLRQLPPPVKERRTSRDLWIL